MPKINDLIVSTLPTRAVEIVNDRQMKGKTFSLGEGKFRHVSSLGAMHVPDNVKAWGRGKPHNYGDLDTDFVYDNNGLIGVGNTFYDIQIDPEIIGYQYTSKLAGRVTVTLVSIGGNSPIVNAPRIVDNQLWWDEVSLGVDLYLVAKPLGVEMFKRIRDENAVRIFTWQVKHDVETALKIQKENGGWDNANRIPAVDLGRPFGKAGRGLEIVNSIVPVSQDSTNVIYQHVEEWTGRTFDVDRKTLEKTYYDNAVYPVIIDTAVNEVITIDSDDGYQYASTWFNHNTSFPNYLQFQSGFLAGFRFQTVGVPNSATINSATLTVESNGGGGGTTSATMYGNTAINPATWSTANRPSLMGRTTANSLLSISGAGVVALDVKTIVQELVNAGGWASGNDMAFGSGSISGSYQVLWDFNNGSKYAFINIDYTAAGGAIISSQMVKQYYVMP